MSSDISIKLQTVLWWITSIAISVLCCSVLFVLFASYLVDVKDSIKDTNQHINSIENREDRILSEIEQMHRKMLGALPVAVPATDAAPSTAPNATEGQMPTPTPAGSGPTDIPTPVAPTSVLPTSPAQATPTGPGAASGSAIQVPPLAPIATVPTNTTTPPPMAMPAPPVAPATPGKM